MINLNNMKTILLFLFFVLTLSVNSQVKVGHNGDTINVTALDDLLDARFRDTLQNSLNIGTYTGIDTNLVKMFKYTVETY
jgi:hypothetical protein